MYLYTISILHYLVKERIRYNLMSSRKYFKLYLAKLKIFLPLAVFTKYYRKCSETIFRLITVLFFNKKTCLRLSQWLAGKELPAMQKRVSEQFFSYFERNVPINQIWMCIEFLTFKNSLWNFFWRRSHRFRHCCVWYFLWLVALL